MSAWEEMVIHEMITPDMDADLQAACILVQQTWTEVLTALEDQVERFHKHHHLLMLAGLIPKDQALERCGQFRELEAQVEDWKVKARQSVWN
jgi:hypothetical protein